MTMGNQVYVYIFVMWAMSYLLRVLPLTLIRKPITNRFLKSFLFYVPYVTLTVMTFPAILSATGSVWSAGIAFAAAAAAAWFGAGMFQVTILACCVVYVLELFI